MRVLKTSYKDKNGQKKQVRKWYIELKDHLQTVRRFPAFEDKRQSEALGRQIERLVNMKIAGEQPDAQLSRWLEQIPAKLSSQLVRIGLIDPQRAAGGKLLKEHIEVFKECMKAKGNTDAHVVKTVARVKKIMEGCNFVVWSDISASRIQRYLAGMREGKEDISAQTFNYYLPALKQFCRWMVLDRRASESPLAHLKGLNTRTDRRHDRRALELDELRLLLETTQKQPARFWLTGPERALLYRIAAETGLWRKELRSLKVSSFDLDNLTVTVKAAYSKRKREDEILMFTKSGFFR